MNKTTATDNDRILFGALWNLYGESEFTSAQLHFDCQHADNLPRERNPNAAFRVNAYFAKVCERRDYSPISVGRIVGGLLKVVAVHDGYAHTLEARRAPGKDANPIRWYRIVRAAVAVAPNVEIQERELVAKVNAPPVVASVGDWLLAVKFASLRDKRGPDGFETDAYGYRLQEPNGAAQVIKDNIGAAFTLVRETPDGLLIFAAYGERATDEEVAMILPTLDSAFHEEPFREFRARAIAWRHDWETLSDYKAWAATLTKPIQPPRTSYGRVHRAGGFQTS